MEDEARDGEAAVIRRNVSPELVIWGACCLIILFVLWHSRRLKTMPYQKYLRTRHWGDLRLRVVRRSRGRCEQCDVKGPLEVHHLTYERRGHERMSDLIALCRSCHEAVHGRNW